jgi:hypothetical protein
VARRPIREQTGEHAGDDAQRIGLPGSRIRRTGDEQRTGQTEHHSDDLLEAKLFLEQPPAQQGGETGGGVDQDGSDRRTGEGHGQGPEDIEQRQGEAEKDQERDLRPVNLE